MHYMGITQASFPYKGKDAFFYYKERDPNN